MASSLQCLSQDVPNRLIVGKEADSFFEFYGSLLKLGLFAKYYPEIPMGFAGAGVGLDCTAQLGFRGGEIAVRQQKRSLRLMALCIVRIQLEAGAVLRSGMHGIGGGQIDLAHLEMQVARSRREFQRNGILS